MIAPKLLDISLLYVEDEQLAREEVAAILRRRVRELITARDGSEGLALFRARRPDLVVTDIRMPVMDGLEMARMIRRECPEALLVVTSAYSDAQALLEAIDIGIDQYVLKPLEVEKLTTAVARCAEIVAARQADMRRQESETRLRAIFENSMDAVGITKGGVQMLGNPAYLALFGYADDAELAGRPLLECIAPGERPTIQARVEQRLRGEQLPMSYVTRGLRRNGEEFALEIHSSTYELAGEVYTLGIMRDISERQRAEALNRKYAGDLEQLLVISREITTSTDPETLYRTFTTVAQEILGLDFSTLMLLSDDGRQLLIADSMGFPASMIGQVRLVDGQCLATLALKNKRVEMVADFEREGRFPVPEHVKQRRIRSAMAMPMVMKDEVIGVLVGHTLAPREFSPAEIMSYQHIGNQAAVAIRNLANAEKLRRSEKYLRDITAALGEGVYVLNDTGEVSFVNPEGENLLGWTEAELLGRNIHDLIHTRRSDGTPLLFADCRMRQVIQTGQRFHSADEVFVRKDGSIFPVAVHCTPLTEGGRVTASVTAFRDISERKRIEEEREQLIAELQQAITEIKTLHGIIPICASCKKIRDEEGAWHQLESYISAHSTTRFSHGLCKDCAHKLYPEYYPDK